MYFLHVHEKGSPTINLFRIRQLENTLGVMKLVVGDKVYLTNSAELIRIINEVIGEERGAYRSGLNGKQDTKE